MFSSYVRSVISALRPHIETACFKASYGRLVVSSARLRLQCSFPLPFVRFRNTERCCCCCCSIPGHFSSLENLERFQCRFLRTFCRLLIGCPCCEVPRTLIGQSQASASYQFSRTLVIRRNSPVLRSALNSIIRSRCCCCKM